MCFLRFFFFFCSRLTKSFLTCSHDGEWHFHVRFGFYFFWVVNAMAAFASNREFRDRHLDVLKIPCNTIAGRRTYRKNPHWRLNSIEFNSIDGKQYWRCALRIQANRPGYFHLFYSDSTKLNCAPTNEEMWPIFECDRFRDVRCY